MNLFTPSRTRNGIYVLIQTIAFLVIPLIFYGQTFVDVSSNPADNGGFTNATVAVTPPGGMQAGDLVVIFAHTRSTSANLAISATGGQTWTTEATYQGGTQTTRIFWCTYNGTWGANPSVSGGNGSNPMSASMYVFRPVNNTRPWDVHIAQDVSNNTGTLHTIVPPAATTVPNTVTMAFWASANDNTWGTLTGAGWSKTGLANQYRNTGGSDQSHTAAYNIRPTAGALADVSQTQSASLNARKMIITWYEVPPPPNDECSGAFSLNSASTCVSTTGSLSSSTYTALTGACGASGGNRRDVWYSFVAQSLRPTISLSSAPSQASLQLFSGNCGSLTSVQCAVNNTTLTASSNLTIGATYYIRVWSDNNTSGSFDICVVDPPSNDECSNAVNLAVTSACNNIPGILSYATASSIPLGGGCTGPLTSDVWYKFTAVNNTARVALSSVSGITGARIEVLTGTCSGFTTVACGTSPLDLTGTLTAGTTYYVRVYNTGAMPTAGTFNICVTSSLLPSVRHGNSYVNISKKTTGGPVQPGDTLEIRMTINHTSGTMYYLRYLDDVPTNTAMLTGTQDSIRVITNEGLTFRKYTLAGGDDAATYLATPGVNEYNIRLNLGFGSFPGGAPANNTTAAASATGRMANTDRPRGGGGILFATAFRVVVTGNVGDTITLNAGQFLYKTTNVVTDPDVTLTANSFQILISDPMDLCANSIGLNNAAELGGTFGTGTSLNRAFDLTVPIPGYSFLNNVSASNGLGDGRYAIVKNISPRSSTNRNANHVPNCGSLPANDPDNCNNRMHGGHWDIDGDHTGTNDAIGNVPPDDNTPGGYMLMVNADYVASEVFSQTLNNLCPNTYYEFSAWFRNICSTCGMDSTGAQFTNPPTAPAAGYVGVYPNLSFALNGLDYYSTGEIDLGGWQKKGFVFRTGPSQTSATFSIRNNSQGGGGNDWVMDDIAVATCLPTMSYSPTINPNVCELNPIIIADTVSSFFNNYTTYKWQRSVNGGANWTDITGVTSLPDTNYYITTYTVPPASTTLADSGTLYRVVVATTADNLSDPNCNISDGVTITLHVLNCEPVLNVDLLSFNGILEDTKSKLTWRTSQEDMPVIFVIERSNDGYNFIPVGEVPGYNNGSSSNIYNFKDPVSVNDKVWYRVVITSPSKKKKYSSTIRLVNNMPDFELTNLVNPFNSRLNFDITVTQNTTITTELIDMSGRTVLSNRQLVYAGTNSITIGNTHVLQSGIYTIRVSSKDRFITNRVVKTN